MTDAGADEENGRLYIYKCPECGYILPPGYGSGLGCSACYEAECEPIEVRRV